jgi:hypothetical protein
VSLIEPSLFTPESVARITGQGWTNIASTFAFGRHFASSFDRQKVFSAITHNNLPGFTADSLWEYREGILSRASIIISHLSSSSSSSLPSTSADRLSPKIAAEAYVTLLILINGVGWRLADDLWVALDDKFMEDDGEVMDAVGQALRGLVGDSRVEIVFTSRAGHSIDRERMRAVVERSVTCPSVGMYLGELGMLTSA